MACGLSNGHVTNDVTWPWKVKLVTPIRLERNISKTTWARDFKFGVPLCIKSGEQAHNYYPESGRGLGHVTPTIFGIRSNISLKLLELETSNWIHGFVWAMPSRRINNFPESRRGLGHVTLTIFGSTVGYPSDSLASCLTSKSTTGGVQCACTLNVKWHEFLVMHKLWGVVNPSMPTVDIWVQR